MKRTPFLSMMLGFVALLAGLWTTSASADIVNGGFESGLTGWISTNEVSQTSAGTDPRTNNALSMVGIGSHSARVGDQNAWGYAGHESSSISQTWTVGSTFKDLYFAWAAVGLVPTNSPHGDTNTPWFQIKIDDVSTASNLFTQQFYTGDINAINPGWVAGATQTGALGQDDDGIWYYRPWEQFHLDMSSYTGDDFMITLTTRDCTLSGHASYAYLDGFGSTPTDIGAVPEPATMLLLGSGLVGLAGLARRRFKK